MQSDQLTESAVSLLITTSPKIVKPMESPDVRLRNTLIWTPNKHARRYEWARKQTQIISTIIEFNLILIYLICQCK